MRWKGPKLGVLVCGVVGLASSLLSGCPREATQVLVHFEVDPITEGRARAIRVRIESQDQEVRLDRVVELGDRPPLVSLPTMVPVSPVGDDASRVFHIEGELSDGDQRVVSEQRAIVGFVEHRRFEVRLRFDDACLERFDCSANQTCRGGECVGAYVVRPGERVDAGTPEPCTDDPCRLVTPQCGCADGLACQVDPIGRTIGCGAPGPGGAHTYCESDGDCNGGMFCMRTNGDTSGSCMPYCRDPSECPGSTCIAVGSPYGACLQACDVIAQTGCPDGTSCYLLRGTTPQGEDADGSMCSTTGTDLLGEPCSQSSCEAGLQCVDSVCARLCRRGEDACPEGQRCGGFDPSFDLRGVQYGYCL